MRDKELVTVLEGWDGTKINIRPSGIDNFLNCPRQWAMYHIGGVSSMPGARAAIGTAIHKAVEVQWQEAITSKRKDFNLTAMADIGVSTITDLDKQGLQYDDGEDLNTAADTVVQGTQVFCEDIVPFTDIPQAVEQRYSMALSNPLVKALSGTVDYIAPKTIGDVKTSKRKPVPANYATQQTTYRLLAEHNGHPIDHCLIQGVILKKMPEGVILEVDTPIDRTKFVINTLLDTGTVFASQKVSPDMLFRGNPKYYLCSHKYCSLHSTCPYVNGEDK